MATRGPRGGMMFWGGFRIFEKKGDVDLWTTPELAKIEGRRKLRGGDAGTPSPWISA